MIIDTEARNCRPAVGSLISGGGGAIVGEIVEHIGAFDAMRIQWDIPEVGLIESTEYWIGMRTEHKIRYDAALYPAVGDYLYDEEWDEYGLVIGDGKDYFRNPSNNRAGGSAYVTLRYLHNDAVENLCWRPGNPNRRNPVIVTKQEALQAVWGAMCSNVWEAIAVCALVGQLQKVKDDLETESVIARGFQRDIKNYREESRRYLRVLEAHNIDDEAEIEAEDY